MERYWRILAGLSSVAAAPAVWLALSLASSTPAYALNAAPYVYAHSWYESYPDYNSMYNQGKNDGAHDNAYCTDAFVVLDFGQIDYENGYGTHDFLVSQNYPFISDGTIRDAVKAYTDGWYAATGPCPRLHVIMALHNYVECPFIGNPCTTSGAGTQWAIYTSAVISYLENPKVDYSWQITAWAGDDMETGWDCSSKTLPFVNAYGSQMSGTPSATQARLIDFGDAWANAPCWTDANIHYKAWGATWDWPLPEIYSQAAADRWTYISQSQGYMNFLGVMTECQGGDQLPYSNCSVNGHTEFAPNQAWNALVNDINSHGVGGAQMEWETNIQHQ
jgi:hypothetical protein